MAAKEDAQEELFKAIQEAASASKSLVTASRAGVLKNLAIAYRLAAGGAQPGGVISES